jgi:hypothetical protein
MNTLVRVMILLLGGGLAAGTSTGVSAAVAPATPNIIVIFTDDNTRAAGEFFGRVRRVAPLLCRLERDYKEADFVTVSNPQVLTHRFVRRPDSSGQGRYLVLASLDGFGPQSFDLTLAGPDHVYDLISRQELTGKLIGMKLDPGEGTVLLAGTPEDYRRDCEFLDQALDREP